MPKITLFQCIDAAERSMVGGAELRAAHKIGHTRRRIDLDADIPGTHIIADDQEVELDTFGNCSFTDIHGKQHTIRHYVERPLSIADVLISAAEHKRWLESLSPGRLNQSEALHGAG